MIHLSMFISKFIYTDTVTATYIKRTNMLVGSFGFIPNCYSISFIDGIGFGHIKSVKEPFGILQTTSIIIQIPSDSQQTH